MKPGWYSLLACGERKKLFEQKNKKLLNKWHFV
jgi:hypothetical protein